MIRTWGYGVAGEDQSEHGNRATGVFQFYRNTLVVLADGGGAPGARLYAQATVRALHDVCKGRQDVGDEVASLVDGAQRAHRLLAELCTAHDLGPPEVSVAAMYLGAEQLFYVVVGKAGLVLVREGKLGHPPRRPIAGTLGGTEPVKVEAYGPFPLKAQDVLLGFVGATLPQLDAEALRAEDWSLPQRGVRRTLERVRGSVPDDAHLAAVLLDKSPEFIRPTLPPNLEVELTELMARLGRSESVDRVAFQLVEDVNPEWGKANFNTQDAAVQREQLVMKDKEEDEEEAPEPLSLLDQILRSFLSIRDWLFEEVRTGRGKRQAQVMAVFLGLVGALLIGAGLFVDFEQLSAEAEPAVEDVDPELYEVVDGQLVRRTQPAPPRATEAAKVPVKVRVDPRQKAEEERLVAEARTSLMYKLGGLGTLALLLLGGLFYRRHLIEKAKTDARRAEEGARRAQLVKALVPEQPVDAIQTFVSSDGSAGTCLMQDPRSGRMALRFAVPPAKKKGVDPTLQRANTWTVLPRGVIDCELLTNTQVQVNKQGGARKEMVRRIEVELRTSDPEHPTVRLVVSHEPLVPGSLEHHENVDRAERLRGWILALRQTATKPSERELMEDWARLVDAGRLTRSEVELLRRALLSRRSTPFVKVA